MNYYNSQMKKARCNLLMITVTFQMNLGFLCQCGCTTHFLPHIALKTTGLGTPSDSTAQWKPPSSSNVSMKRGLPAPFCALSRPQQSLTQEHFSSKCLKETKHVVLLLLEDWRRRSMQETQLHTQLLTYCIDAERLGLLPESH